MVALRRTFAASLLLTLGACVTVPDITQSRSPCRSEPGGWCGFTREIALESYPYAIAATSAYQGDSDIYPDDALGVGLVRVDRLKIADEDLGKGFGYQLFDQYKVEQGVDAEGNPVPVRGEYIGRIVAFRGTDFGFKDVFQGSLTKRQNDIALKYFDAERARPEARHITTWFTSGHSLGGALATEVSAKYPEVRAWMFNTSPFLKVAPQVNDLNRTVINERGDWLGQFRKYDDAPAARIVVLNCAPHKNSATKHKIRQLSDCITWIAAYDSLDALKVVRDNMVAKPPVECGDAGKVHPGPGYREPVPCTHIARPKTDD
jgi:hypothetical protein